MTPPTIYGIDEPDSTIYVLIENGEVRAWHWWPHPLRRLCPEAVDGGTLGLQAGLLPERTVEQLPADLIAAVLPRTEVPQPL